MVSPDGSLASWEGCVLSTSGVLFLISYLTATAVGFNRLSWIPVIVSIATFIGTLGAFLADPFPDGRGTGAIYTVRLLAYLGWHVEETAATFYSYFILEAILGSSYDDDNIRRWLRRRYFMGAFWALSITNIGVRIAMTAMYVVWWGIDSRYPPGTNPPLLAAIEKLDSAQYMFLALIEILNAYGLLMVFHFAIKNSEMYCGGERVGLFKRMALSTEVRVGSLAIIGIIRAAVNLPGAQSNHRVSDLAKFFWNAQHLYVVVLITDLLISKIAAPRFVKRDKSGSTETGMVITGQLPPLAAAPKRRPGHDDVTTSTFDVSIMTRSLIAPDTKDQIEKEQQLVLMRETSGSDLNA